MPAVRDRRATESSVVNQGSTNAEPVPGALDFTKLKALEESIIERAQAQAASKQARSTEEEREGVTRAALNQRQRRLRPDVKASETKALKARDGAMRLLAKKHPEEFMVLVQEERQRLGLPPLQPRGKHRRALEERAHAKQERTPQTPAPKAEQGNCIHSQHPVKKLSYGKFCGGCGKRI